ncbi:hypothetical protein SAMN05421770_10555 [Granulicella rosea]|uniref:Uncharacterized protein n=1 Tax=Granulicella rosea TaxID=474952 RepID=A0A239KND1_9BACT|nr:hypothetical protein SAMN05421770_10548 [Granulicella rosea]SNT19113.1 hypothetical protein SAMN05421770_10555 [Granulicella rosea]
MNLTQSLTLGFVPACRFCVLEVETTVAQAIREPGVRAISIRAENRCQHETAKDLTARLQSSKVTSMPKPAPDAATAASEPAPHPPTQPALPGVASPLNGLDG